MTPEALGQVVWKARVYKSPTPPKEWVEKTVRSLVRSDPGVAKNPTELLRLVRVEAKKSNYRPIIPPAQVEALLRKK